MYMYTNTSVHSRLAYVHLYIQSAHDDSATFHTFDVCADMYVRVHVRCMCGVCAGCMCGMYVRGVCAGTEIIEYNIK